MTSLITKEEMFAEIGVDTRPDAELSCEQVIERNLKVVEAHFHNENPDNVEKAVALYAPDISWEAPSRGMVYTDREEVLKAYRAIFRTLAYRKTFALRRFATETYVFDDQVAYTKLVGDPDDMPNIPFVRGQEMSTRLVHCFEMRDGLIARELVYEVWRHKGAPNDHDFIPEGTPEEIFPEFD